MVTSAFAQNAGVIVYRNDQNWWGSSLRFDSSPYDAYLILGSEVALTDPT